MRINLSILALSLLTLSCSKNESTESVNEQASATDVVTLTEAQIKNANLTTGAYSEELVTSVIKASGRLEAPPQNVVTISTPFSGFIKSMDLLQGMRISKGQVIVQLQHPDYIVFQQNYLEQKSDLEFLESEYQRQLELAKDNINAQKEVQAAKSKFEIAKAKVDGLKARLQLMNLDISKVEQGGLSSTFMLYAPINGYVTEINVNLGQYVNPDNVILKIIDNQHLHAELRVFEKDILKIRIGQEISFVLNGDDRVRKAKVHLIGKEISAERTITIHGHLEKEDPELLPGMFMTAEIETNQEKANLLPEEAVVKFEGESFIFLAESKNKFKMVKVSLGSAQNGKVAVEFPPTINNQSTLVLTGAYSLLSMLRNGEPEF